MQWKTAEWGTCDRHEHVRRAPATVNEGFLSIGQVLRPYELSCIPSLENKRNKYVEDLYQRARDSHARVFRSSFVTKSYR